MNALDRITDGFWLWGWLVFPILTGLFGGYWSVYRPRPGLTLDQRGWHAAWLSGLLNFAIGAFFIAVTASRL